jgi:RNA polymerase sigma-70 factor, ECF subfamily
LAGWPPQSQATAGTGKRVYTCHMDCENLTVATESRVADAVPRQGRPTLATARTYRLQTSTSATIAKRTLPSVNAEGAAHCALPGQAKVQVRVQLPERPTHRTNGCVLTGSVARPRRTESSELPEADAIRLAQQGDAGAFERLYRLHNRRVYSLCLRMVGNTAEAEDLTQEAFLQLFRKIATFRGESAFSTWLHRLAVNVVLMKLRKKSGTETSLEEVTEPDEETGGPRRDFGGPDLTLSGSIDRLNLQRAVEQLPPGYKAVFVLHDMQGYEHNEIAKIMGCSIGNSKSQLHKARMRLRELLHEALREKAREERRAAGGSAGED